MSLLQSSIFTENEEIDQTNESYSSSNIIVDKESISLCNKLVTYDTLIYRAAELIKNSKAILFISGAGMSADSGLSTYSGVGSSGGFSLLDELGVSYTVISFLITCILIYVDRYFKNLLGGCKCHVSQEKTRRCLEIL
jgi:hypothetical protein